MGNPHSFNQLKHIQTRHKIRDQPFSTNAKFSDKLLFMYVCILEGKKY